MAGSWFELLTRSGGVQEVDTKSSRQRLVFLPSLLAGRYRNNQSKAKPNLLISVSRFLDTPPWRPQGRGRDSSVSASLRSGLTSGGRGRDICCTVALRLLSFFFIRSRIICRGGETGEMFVCSNGNGRVGGDGSLLGYHCFPTRCLLLPPKKRVLSSLRNQQIEAVSSAERCPLRCKVIYKVHIYASLIPHINPSECFPRDEPLEAVFQVLLVNGVEDLHVPQDMLPVLQHEHTTIKTIFLLWHLRRSNVVQPVTPAS